jgi:predicted nucleic acid-binding protein
MAIVCLDTDVLVDIIRADEPLSRLRGIRYLGSCTTIITLLELYYGAFKSGKQDDLALIEFLKNDIVVLELSEGDVKLAGKIMADLDKKGLKVDFRDVVIGAICINEKITLMTRNIKHFKRMESYGLSITTV